jgi:molybdopterin/thiamine biosynthesis adenylyltransferase
MPYVPLHPYDVAAYEQFCSALVADGFNPTPGTAGRRWTGPLRPSMRPLTTATRMTVVFYDGWPFRYAHVVIDGLDTGHAANGTICLWAEDDPAQLNGATLLGLWARLDEWTETGRAGWTPADRALDGYVAFEGLAKRFAEIDLPDLLHGASNGHVATVFGKADDDALSLDRDATDRPLRGSLYYRSNITRAPRTFDEVKSLLTNRQRSDLDSGLAARQPVDQNEVSGGHDHVILVWPRHEAHDALVLSFSGSGDSLKAHPNEPSPSDRDSRLRRAGPDAQTLLNRKVLIAGVGAIGGHLATTLAHSGTGHLMIRDSDNLRSVNLVRHVLTAYNVGYSKSIGLYIRLKSSAPWCEVDVGGNLPHDPADLAAAVTGYHLVVDCTGIHSLTSALAHVCAQETIPLLTGALYHQGAILRIRRQRPEDTPILARAADARYRQLPPDQIEEREPGFLELGCTAPVHNAPPAAVLRAAADITSAAIDTLTDRLTFPDETITVLRPLAIPPFDQVGVVDAPTRP